MKFGKKVIVIGVVLIFSLMPIESFAGEDWKLMTELPTKRWEFSTAVVEDKIYIIGGSLFENRAGPFGLSTVEVYDPQTNTWQRGADMPTPRTNAKAAVVDGTIYVFGGYNSKDKFLQNWKMADHVEAYDPLTDTWTQKKEMPISRFYFGLGVVAGKVYLIGGTTGLGEGQEQRMDRVDIYDPATDTWAKGPKMPTRRNPGGVAVVSTRIYVIGGEGWPLPRVWGADQFLGSIEVYDPINRQWEKKKDMLEIKNWFPSVVVEGAIYLIGGYTHEGGLQEVATVNVYHPRTETWREISALPNPLGPFDAATVNGKIYVFGSLGAGARFSTDVLVYETGFCAVTAKDKLFTQWGELKAEPQRRPQRD
ncbi:hypothetical protein C6500_08435 [Candidatus Poribacteria bacterium]|nr:MAG: hypothetical protein C6500_08435 [Candidatus Poribacteria bacterium]